jgi:hypothetical protein
MARWLVLALMLCAASLPAEAKTYAIPATDPVATISFPDSWTIEELDYGVEGEPSDSSIYVAVEAHDLVDIKSAVTDVLEYLDEKGVTVDVASQKEFDFKIGTLEAREIAWKATDEDGPTNVSLTVVGIPQSGKLLLVTYWGSPEADAKHHDALVKIVNSIQATKR